MKKLTSDEIEQYFSDIYKDDIINAKQKNLNKYAIFPAIYVIWKYAKSNLIDYPTLQLKLLEEFNYNIASSYHFSQDITQTKGNSIVTDNARFLQNIIEFKVDNPNDLKKDPDGYYYSKGLPKTHFKIQDDNIDALSNMIEIFKNDNMEIITKFMKEKREDVATKRVAIIPNNPNYNDARLVLEENGIKDKSSLNQILYGPPGTGKTYNTINKALEIILEAQPDDEIRQLLDTAKNNELTREERKKLTDKFKKLKDARQIEFVTFHQSYGYEEFVEGIKAIPKNRYGNDSDEMIYDVVDGIFKRLSNNAIYEYNFDSDLRSYLNLGDKIKLKDNKAIEIIDIDDTSLKIKNHNGEEFSQLFSTIKKAIINIFEKKDVRVTYQYRIAEYIISKIYKRKKKYILIIDEINRGNISKIFGELITLIEPSKRIEEDEEIRVKLPYSGDNFGVPSNLYIIGTMNTADRSIAQIDTALRRRFVFEEMMPKPKLLSNIKILKSNGEDTDINVEKILEAINERIEYLYDREHTIGHSYFMDLLKDGCNTKAKLDEIFRVNIIPLLAEYFYGDWNDIKIILHDTKNYFITEKKTPTYIIDESKKNNKIYTVNQNTLANDGFSIKGYKKIYKMKEANSKPDNLKKDI